jgi:hypothetical protein
MYAVRCGEAQASQKDDGNVADDSRLWNNMLVLLAEACKIIKIVRSLANTRTVWPCGIILAPTKILQMYNALINFRLDRGKRGCVGTSLPAVA